jgi:8-oxo-dGTP pyrophosphatase MutT (NUDIX family)
VAEHDAIVHLFLVSTIGAATVVFLLETEPGVVEFPRLEVEPADLDDEATLVRRIREQTGMDVAISGFLDHPLDGAAAPVGKLVLARHLGGAPRLTLPHVGWEWTPGSQLITLPFAPKMMLDELKAFMDT